MPLSCSPVPGLCFRDKLESYQATKLIAWYTFLLHLLIGFYFLDVYRGKASDWVPSPIFEYSTDEVQPLSLFLAILCFLYMVLASLSLIRGLKTETRIYYFPWLCLTAVEIFFVFYHAVWLIFRYPYDTSTLVTAVFMLIYISYHTYLYIVVLSNYNYLKRIQNPTLVFPPENWA